MREFWLSFRMQTLAPSPTSSLFPPQSWTLQDKKQKKSLQHFMRNRTSSPPPSWRLSHVRTVRKLWNLRFSGEMTEQVRIQLCYTVRAAVTATEWLHTSWPITVPRSTLHRCGKSAFSSFWSDLLCILGVGRKQTRVRPKISAVRRRYSELGWSQVEENFNFYTNCEV